MANHLLSLYSHLPHGMAVDVETAQYFTQFHILHPFRYGIHHFTPNTHDTHVC